MRTQEDIARLLHEVLESIGWSSTPEEIATRLVQLDRGLPAEDEFMAICSWLGQCTIIHKLDQLAVPSSSRHEYQIPDLLAEFVVGKRSYPVLIEVKTTSKNVLSMRPDYMQRLSAYGRLLGLPVLLAWKWKGIWTLVEIRHLVKAEKNFNINWQSALSQSLLSSLAGDFAFSLSRGSGLHINFKKLGSPTSTVDAGQHTEQWNTVIDAAYFTDSTGKQWTTLENGLHWIFFTSDLDEQTTLTDTHVHQSFVAQDNAIVFAHNALVRILNYFTDSDDRVHWRRHLQNPTKLTSVSDFRHTVEDAMQKQFVHHILDIKPQTKPEFMKSA